MVLGWNVEIQCKCSKCGGLAIFDKSPFKFIAEKKGSNQCLSKHRFNGCFVIEKYPNVYPWDAKEHQHFITTFKNYGVLKCSSCGYITKHELKWPEDAYYLWGIRNTVLWAVNKNHAEFLLDYIQNKIRNNKRDYKSYKLPALITSSKNRTLVVKKISSSLK